MDEMFEKSEVPDEVSERAWRRATATAKIGRAVAEAVLQDADEKSMIMRRDGAIHLIGELRELRGSARVSDGDEDDDETR